MGTIPASENEFPQVLFAEGAAPATPGTGLVVCYAKTDGLLYCKDDAGVETAYAAAGTDLAAHIADTADAHDASAVSVLDTLGSFTGTDVEAVLAELYAAIGAGGIPASTVDGKGELIVGTADNTVDNLAVGANGLMLTAASGETTGLKWAVPTIPYVTADATADVDLTADTPTDITGCSVSLAAGTWFVEGMAVFSTPSTTTYTVLFIATAANAYSAAARGLVTSSAPVSAFCHAVVTPGSTTTYKLRGQVGFTTADVLRYGTSTIIGTRITAVRLL